MLAQQLSAQIGYEFSGTAQTLLKILHIDRFVNVALDCKVISVYILNMYSNSGSQHCTVSYSGAGLSVRILVK